MDQSKKKFLKNMVGFSMMTWISFLLGFISSPIATRLFVPEELAKFNMFSTYGSLIASVCYLGLDQAYVRFFREPPGKSTRKSLYTFCTLVPLAFSLVAALVLSFFWRSLSVQVMGTESRSVFVQLCLFSFFLVLFRFLSLSYRMEQNAKLYTIQVYLKKLMDSIAFLKSSSAAAEGAALAYKSLPTESARMAIAIIAILPILLVYPFIQKELVKGMVVGGVKG